MNMVTPYHMEVNGDWSREAPKWKKINKDNERRI